MAAHAPVVHRIGVLFGMENAFPDALVDRLNSSGVPGISAEFVRIGAVRMDAPSGYRVLIDRISHEIPFYRAFLKTAALDGTAVINNPFWWGADDRFFNGALAARLGVAIPPTVALPHKEHPPNTTAQSMRNLVYPMNWGDVFEYVGFPAVLRPSVGASARDLFVVRSPKEFFDAYDQTRDLSMILQRAVHTQAAFRCYVVGQQAVRVMPYDPLGPHQERYLRDWPAVDATLIARLERDALTLCRSLGYDVNLIEFEVEDGVPFATDFLNPVPDADLHAVGHAHFDWFVNAVADLAVRRALEPPRGPELRWNVLRSGEAPADA